MCFGLRARAFGLYGEKENQNAPFLWVRFMSTGDIKALGSLIEKSSCKINMHLFNYSISVCTTYAIYNFFYVECKL